MKLHFIDRGSESFNKMVNLFSKESEQFLEWALRDISEEDRKVFSDKDKLFFKICFMHGAWFGKFGKSRTQEQ